ncbi:TPA: hypothetical protein I7737_21425 [Vibrio vulnificus]|nr:hypothetical protein [Vibrio vulnificus]
MDYNGITDPEIKFLLRLTVLVEHIFTTTIVLVVLVSFLLVCWILDISIDQANHLYTYASESPIGYTISALIGFLGTSYYLILKVLHRFVRRFYWSKFEEAIR